MKLTALLISSLLTLTSIASLTPSLESDLDPANLDDDLDLNDHFDLEDLSQLNDTSALEIRQNPGPGNCARGVHVIAAGGDGAPNVGHYGNIYSLVQSILYAIPGSDSVSLPYPKGSPHGIKKTEKGSKNLSKYLRRYHRACPKTKIVLAGYSAGGIITMNTLCGASSRGWHVPKRALGKDWTKTVIATIIYGDETFTPNQPYNRGTCTHGTSSFPRTRPQGCRPFMSSIRAYCDIGDPRCCQGNNWDDHFNYFSRYDRESAAFVRGKWLASRG